MDKPEQNSFIYTLFHTPPSNLNRLETTDFRCLKHIAGQISAYHLHIAI